MEPGAMSAFLFLHIAGGSLAVIGGYAALFAPKGGSLHRQAGTLFVYAMIAMGIGAMVVGLSRGKSTWTGGPIVIYLVVTSLLTVRPMRTPSRTRDVALMLLALALAIGSVVASARIIMGPRTAPVPGVTPPIFIAVAGLQNALVLFLCVAGDVNLLRSGPATGRKRLARHLWRMCYAMFTATGSFFLGQAKVIPEPLRIGPVLTLLAFLPLPLMFYWLWRVRRRSSRIVTRTPLAGASRAAALVVAMILAAPALNAQPSARARVFYNQGRTALQETDYPTAIQSFERAIELDDANADHHYWLGRALSEVAPRVSKFKLPMMARRVMKEMERAVALDSAHVDARVALAEFYAMAPGFMGGGKDKARAQAAVVTRQSAMRGAMVDAEIARQEKNWNAEQAAFERAIAVAPDSSSPYVGLADAFVRVEKADAAFVTIKRYATRRPDDRWTLYYTGRLAGTSGQQLDEGEKAMQEFLATPPKDITLPARARALYWFGKIAERRGNKLMARERYQAALQANPKYELANDALESLR
jgi:tetratricopeptide (TPR) repeat protein